ncbi:MAG: hypothetical protein EBZ05_03185 [Verrucomicrobia bacterium]|nr:hypothetical protein [Verrucomicrobiota bacterium]
MKHRIKRLKPHWRDCSAEGADLSVLREGWQRAWKDWIGGRVSCDLLKMAAELPPFLRPC